MIKLFLITFSLMFLIPSIACFVNGEIISAIMLLLGSFIGFVLLITVNSKKRKLWYLMPITLSIFGILVIMTYCLNADIPNKVETTGEIVSLEKASNLDDESNKYYPVVKYNVNDKIYYEKIKSQYSNFLIGEEISLFYNSKKTSEVNIKPNFFLLLGGIIFVIFGIVFCFMTKVRYDKMNGEVNKE